MITAVLCCCFSLAEPEPIRFPADSGVIDVTKAPYLAVPNDSRDDTIAIQRALNDHTSGNVIFYFPPGTYDISHVLLTRPDGDPLKTTHACLELRGSKKRNILQGAGESLTILRLSDDVPAEFAQAMLNFGQAPAQRFRNSLRDLTVSIGTGHPNAVGVEFNASNQGTVRNVTIRSDDPDHRGGIGLHLGHTDEIGPCLISEVTVDGFDVGIRTAFQTASQTFEHVTLRNQLQYGWQNGFSQSIFMRDLRSVNAVTALMNVPAQRGDPGESRVVLLDGDLRGVGEASKLPAIRNQKSMYLRDVTTPGYASAVTRELNAYRGNALESDTVEEYWANGAYENRRGGPFELFPSPDGMLRLPIEEPPAVEWETDLTKWRGPHQHQSGEPGKGSGFPNDGVDDSEALQKAIDSGATTVYLPNGVWNLKRGVILRGDVRRMIGCEARLIGPNGGQAVVRIEDGTSPVVLVERLESGNIVYQHASRRNVRLEHILGGAYQSVVDSPGKLFLSDVVISPLHIKNQHVWARQLDIEGSTEEDPSVPAKLVNDGGTVWVLGLKIEDAGTVVKTVHGGRTEVYGTLHVGGAGDAPRFVTEDASFAVAGIYGGGFRVLASETRNGQTRQAKDFRNADIYTAFGAEAVLDREIVIDTEAKGEAVRIVGEWLERSGYGGGFHGENCLHDANAEKGSKSVTFIATVPAAAEYEVFMKWPVSVSGFGLAENVPVEVAAGELKESVLVNQSRGGGGWNQIGRFRFESGPVSMTIATKGTRGHVVADAIRLRRVRD